MRDRNGNARSILLSVLVAVSVLVGSVAVAGVGAAATNASIQPDDDDAGATGVTYTAEGDAEQSDTLQYVDVHLGPANASAVDEADVDVYIGGSEYTSGLTQFSASGGTVEFKLSSSKSVSAGETVRIVVADVTNPSDDFSANATLHDTGDAEWGEIADGVAIDAPPEISYHDLRFDDGTGGVDTTVDVGETLTVSATVENSGEQTGTYNASLVVDGAIRQFDNGTLAGGSNTTTTFGATFDATGAYDVTVKDLAATEVTVTGVAGIAGGTATPATVSPGETVADQSVSVAVANVSQDGETDRYYVEFPDELAGNLSVDAAGANTTTVTSNANLVEGYDDDGVAETVTFATSGDGGGDVALNLTVDLEVDYPGTETTYGVDARVVDSDATTTTVASPTVSVAPAVPDVTGNGLVATDPDDDGLYEDVTGDRTFNVIDVAVFLNVFDSQPVVDARWAFDFKDDGTMSIVDVAALLRES